MCHNQHRAVDELGRLRIARAPHSHDSLDISFYDFWTFGGFKGTRKHGHLQDFEEFLAFSLTGDKCGMFSLYSRRLVCFCFFLWRHRHTSENFLRRDSDRETFKNMPITSPADFQLQISDGTG
jgi:hypothetical protein